MRKPALAFLAVIALLAGACASASAPSSNAIFTLEDPRGDDHGGGSLVYPMSGEIQRGELDLLRLEAFREAGGTMFEATFARPVRPPVDRTIDAIGTSLEDVARLGFYTLNIDLYIDKDHQPESGSVSTLPGRNVVVDPRNAWEKAVIVTPDPGLARTEFRRLLMRTEKKRMESEQRRGVLTEEMKAQMRADVDTYIYFADRVEVHGSRLRFFVPDSFLGGPAQPDWAYAVLVSGADLVQRTDQQGRLQRSGETANSLMVLPIGVGRPNDIFGGAVEDDPYATAVVDVLVPQQGKQETILNREQQIDLPAQIPAIVPAAREPGL